ncbi:MAG: cytochrome c family protein [Alphaproteobacteria bacterium PA4]|nr:MAG: cytochrome c family protein [Alphaproteobacteria bacterium PA4]
MTRLLLAALLLGLAAPAAADDAALLKRGGVLSMRCATCHEFAAGKPNKVGPNLHGVIGGPAGKVAGFAYSQALGGSGVVWTDAVLDTWLERPTAVVPGTKMAFVGLPKPEDRQALILWLKKATR